MTYKIIVYDNFHYMDFAESYEHGAYATAGDAVLAAQKIVDDFLAREYRPGMKARELYKQYTSFGDDPHIDGPAGGRVDFSAWKYAGERCAEICGEPFRAIDEN